MRESEREMLVEGALKIGVGLQAAQTESLLRLVDELQLGNAQFNLTGIRDRPGMLRKHVLDSLT
ncbi:MAG TPA: RsmG family class I SAM-dependent methyltransferase, partial [Steroidobacteraceae bacterium]|nr:RsmG family class I SAM-dependent methyltransferase [Steroidobacteraceae bacterium]